MGELQDRPRDGRFGKLIDVLDHRLRIGDEGVSKKLIAAYKERGLVIPEHLENPPQIENRFLVYWEAFQDFQSERRAPRGPIPISAILKYCQAYGLDPDRIKRIVWKVDRVLLDHWKVTDEAEKAKRDAEAKAKNQRGARS